MNCQKHLFDLPEDIHYLNCAYMAPLLKSAEQKCTEQLIKRRNPTNISSEHFFSEVDLVKEKFAKIINTHAKNIAIVASTSYGFSSVLNNLTAKPNGNAITIAEEFPSGYFSLQKWCHSNNNEFVVVDSESNSSVGKRWNENILSAINEKTSVVLISSVHWMNGVRFDLKAIGSKCQEVGAKLIVDGTQSVGALPIDVDDYHIDALICATYKWMFGPYSIALAYISEAFHDGTPLEESWMNRTNSRDFTNLTSYDYNYAPHANRYNVGQLSNMMTMPMLNESLRQIIEWGPNNIQTYCASLTDPLFSFLDKMGVGIEQDEYFCYHLFALQLPDSVDQSSFKEKLAQHKIFASSRGDKLRVSFNVFNDEHDIEKLMQVIEMSVMSKTLI